MIAVDTRFEGLVQLFVSNRDWSTLARLLIQIDIDPDSNKSENKYVAFYRLVSTYTLGVECLHKHLLAMNLPTPAVAPKASLKVSRI